MTLRITGGELRGRPVVATPEGKRHEADRVPRP